MKLQSFRVSRYRNVLDSGEVLVEGDVTTLVGMNESGKSTMLDALYRLNPVYGDKFVELDDYPRWRRSRDSRNEDLQAMSPIDATFELDQEDLEALEEALGEGVVTPGTVQVGRRYNDSHWVRVEVDERRFVRNVLDGHRDAASLAEAHETVASLKTALTALVKEEAAAAAAATTAAEASEDEPSPAKEVPGTPTGEVLDRIADSLGAGGSPGSVAESAIWSRLPKFFLFTDYQSLEGRVDVAELKTQSDERPGASPKQTARALLKLANTDVNAMTDSNFESSTAELESVSNDLSREMKEY